MQDSEILKAFNNVIWLLNEVEKARRTIKGWKLLGSKKNEMEERKFKEILEATKNSLESNLWYGKGFAIRAECGTEVDVEFHQLIGVLIEKFSDISLRLAPEKLDTEFIGYLRSQLEMLRDTARHFWDIQEIRKDDLEKEKKVLTITQNFRTRLFEFERSMEPYLRKTEVQKAVEAYLEK